MSDPKQLPTPRLSGQSNPLIKSGVAVAIAIGLFVTHHLILGIFFLLASAVMYFSEKLKQVPTPQNPRITGETLSNDAKEVRHSLAKAQYLENIDTALGLRALNQFDQIVDRQKQFSKSLDLRFERSELAYERYSNAAGQVCAAVLDQLKRIAEILSQLNTMNLKQAEAQGMSERLEMGRKLQTNLHDFLNRNESAITELDRVILAVSEVKTSKSNPGAGTASDYDALLVQLQELADRAKQYSL